MKIQNPKSKIQNYKSKFKISCKAVYQTFGFWLLAFGFERKRKGFTPLEIGRGRKSILSQDISPSRCYSLPRFSFYSQRPRFLTGFTLIEILVSIAVIAILAAITWAGLASFRESDELNQGVGSVLSFLKDARTRTLASERAKQYGVHFEETQIILFEGTSYISENVIETFRLPSLVRISDINLAGGGQDVVFERLTGKTPQPGTIDLESRRNNLKRRTIQILESGFSAAQ